MKLRLFAVCSALPFVSTAPAAPGDVEAGFSPSLSARSHGASLQPDGAAVLSGGYSSINGLSRLYLARIGPDGSLEPGYNPSGGPGGRAVYSTQLTPDGGVLAGGTFSTFSGVTRRRLAKFSAAGVLEAGFNLDFSDEIYSLAQLPDGRVVAGGIFTTINGTTRNRIARLHSNGTLDEGFNPAANDNVRCLIPLPAGGLLMAGNFTSVFSTARNRLARITAADTLDAGFAPSLDAAAYTAALQADGKILVGGGFSFVGALPRNRIARLHADGSVDLSFNPGANDLVRSIAVQADGRMIITGNFTVVAGQPRNRIARLHSDGTLDTTFAPNANAIVFGATLQDDGKVHVCGDFTTMNGVTRNCYARLLNDAATQSLSVPSPARIVWLRGGASPEVFFTAFEYLPAGAGSPVALGMAQRINGGWELASLNLPQSGSIRVRGITRGGYGNGTAGIMEKTLPYSFSDLEWWRYSRFGTTAATGNAADNADPDKDGLENLVEFAFGRNPNVPDAAALPQWVLDDDGYSFTFTRPAGVTGITYIGEYSTSMAPGSWAPAVNGSTPPAYNFLAPVLGSRLYLRVRVTVP